MLALFAATEERHDMPAQSKHVLGVTSLWMILPAYHGMGRLPALAAVLACVCAVSTTFWANPVWGSAMHKADKAVSWVFTMGMLLHSEREFLTLTPFIVFFFLLSDAFFRREWHVLQLAAHLGFRYVFYVWSHMVLWGDVGALARMTIGYVAHVAFVYFAVDYRFYWLSALASAISIVVLGLE